MDNKIKAVFAVNPKNEDIAFEKIVSNNVKEDEPIFYIDNEIMLQNPFDTEENRAMLYAKTIESCERQIQSLKSENEMLREALNKIYSIEVKMSDEIDYKRSLELESVEVEKIITQTLKELE